ncbi:hypothetical protein RHMOL_Rhmol06G0082300 [Rhododendron molle]|uniref:Uncharacterized protein n=1 Tax=Rhododendron molle TaxID=49168 RepID=A0ACC0NAD3_RHOML|nr:hypothetical protein RHMOL_Rhmol06G0082300 [Rhododendron molle]
MDSGEVKKENGETFEKKNEKITIRKRRSSLIPKFGCFRSDDYDVPTVERPDGRGNLVMESVSAGENRSPTHLVIMVNGLIGSAQDWRYASKQLIKRYPQDVIVHCSESNYSTLTFHGVDVTGNRLADEVIAVIERYPYVKKLSFIAHSLGGLIARYAIAKLYDRVITHKTSQENGECRSEESKDSLPQEKFKGKIAGLEPMNFITFATPHLGSRGHKQAPAFCGIYTLEKVVSRASWFLGRTGNHLFLRDGGEEKLPLLVQMANDSDGLPFISALQSFRRRVAYANARYDHLVGWGTSSLRRQSELPRRKSLSRSDTYPHIINVEEAKAADTGEEMSLEAQVNRCKTITMEEAMIRGLTKVSWERVDVDFRGTTQRFLAHNTIQATSASAFVSIDRCYRLVNSSCMNSDGADVIQHMVDNFVL